MILMPDPSLPTFIGVDLAWQTDRKPTGAVVLRGDCSGAELVSASILRSSQGVLDFVLAHTEENTVLAIDAPLIITNATGQRTCETLVGKRYGSREASCHTSNLARFSNALSLQLTSAFLTQGFVHVDRERNERRGRLLSEVYPHAAMVALFNLPKIIKYKKGLVATKRQGLVELQNLLGTLVTKEPALVLTEPLRSLIGKDVNLIAGRSLKEYEDCLDALFCAYLAYYFWYWGWDRNELFGNVESGYILNPTPQPL